MTRKSKRAREILRSKRALARASEILRWTDVVALVAFLSGAACGDDDGAAGNCNGVVAGACARLDACKVLSAVEQCRRDQSRVMHCDEVQDVGATYDKCVADIEARDCPAWTTALNQDFALPDSCRTAFTVSSAKK